MDQRFGSINEPGRSAGFGLLSVLFLLTVLGFLATYSVLHLTHSIKLVQVDLRSIRELGTLRERLPAALQALEQYHPASERTLCPGLSSQESPTHLSLLLCLLISLNSPDLLNAQRIDGSLLSPASLFPLIDYDLLFPAPAACSLITFSGTALPFSGDELSPGSAIAGSTCTPQAQVSESFSTLCNLANDSALLLRSEAAVLAAAGFMELAGGLTIEGDSLIVAGGDLSISEIHAATPARVTAISATGRIKIESCDPTLQLKVIARQGAEYPSSAATQATPLLPPLRASLLLGLQ